jgi:hypothetical protein
MSMCVYNLVEWRPFFLNAAMHAFLKPSGLIPGAEKGRRALRCSSTSVGED